MASQEVVWTVLPRGIGEPLPLQAGRRLRLSVLVSPRLGGTDTGGGGPIPVQNLVDFPEFVDWPATLTGTGGDPIAFDVEFVDGPVQEARRVSVGDDLEPDS